MADLTETEIRERVDTILEASDLSEVTTKSVLKSLEEHFSVELTIKREFVKECINDFVNRMIIKSEDEPLPDVSVNTQSSPTKSTQL